jgi:hypothetical protein
MVDKKNGRHFIGERPITSANNLIMGPLYLDLHGMTKITNVDNGEYVELEYLKRGWRDKNAYALQGNVFSKTGMKMYTISGTWKKEISIFDNQG